MISIHDILIIPVFNTSFALLLTYECSAFLLHKLTKKLEPIPGGGGGGTWVKFCWVCATGISEPLPHYSLFLVYFEANYKPHLSHFWANDFLTLKVPKKCDTILVTLLKMLEKATPL